MLSKKTKASNIQEKTNKMNLHFLHLLIHNDTDGTTQVATHHDTDDAVDNQSDDAINSFPDDPTNNY